MKNHKIQASVAAIAAFLFAGCIDLGSSNSKDGDGFSVKHEMEVMAITSPSGSEPGTITTRSVEGWCVDGEAVVDTVIETMSYVIANGHLYLWEDGDCYGEKFSGSSAGIVGTWTTTSLAPVPVPAAYRPEDCDEYEDEDAFLDSLLFANVHATYTVTEEKVSAQISGELCMANMFAVMMFSGWSMDAEPMFEVTTMNCTSAKIRNIEENLTATITSKYSKGDMKLTFSHAEKKCTLTERFDVDNSVPPMCTEGGEEEFDDSFFYCMLESGFFGSPDEELMKSSAPAYDFTKKLREAMRSAAKFP